MDVTKRTRLRAVYLVAGCPFDRLRDLQTRSASTGSRREAVSEG